MIVLEFERLDDWRDAVRALAERGVAGLDAHSPASVDGIAGQIDAKPSPVRPVMLVAAAISAVAIWGLQYWHAVLAYPLNSGGRPYNAWPAFGFPIFETAILGAAIAGFVALLVACRLPMLAHPFFDSVTTEAASDDRFFITLASEQSPPIALAELAQLPGVTSFFEVRS